MADFLTFVRRMVCDRAMLTLALALACLSAVLTGAGILSLVPVIQMIVDQESGKSLPDLARSFNAEGHTLFSGMNVPLSIPEGLINLLPADRFAGVVFVVVFIGILTLIGATANFFHQYLSITVAARTIARARHDAFETAIGLPMSVVTVRGASEFIARIVRDTAEVQRGLIALMSKSVAQVTQGVAVFCVALLVGRSLTLIALVTMPVLFIVLRKLGKRIRRGTRGALQGQEDLLRLATEAMQGIRSVKANTGEAQVIEQFDAKNEDVVHQELRARLARAFSSPLVETLAIIVVGFLACVAAKQILDGTLTVERFVIALGALALSGSKFKMLANLIAEMQAASAPARRIMDVLNEPPEEASPNRLATLAPHASSIVFDDVSLVYPGKTDAALRNVSLRIPFDERIAFVGPNGSGKTTLLSLVPRLLVPASGRVLIDDVDLSTVSLKSLRRQVAVVTQETMLFRGTVAANIAFGMENVTRDQIIDAAHRAHAHEFIEQMPGGYDADIAEQGASLSGGQRQRLAIARAILRHLRMLILYEATSQIDAESESRTHTAVTEFSRGPTVLVI
ncbi:MAG: ABC transporter ATP-binding protein, partial [Phycisphaerales bacterium]|nr:ABC transporter ATP-binding protein [Phycisphaerales bacterium]